MAISFTNCTLCPHRCSVNREQGELGFCRLDAGLHIANISLHKGEEPIDGSENGVCNVFFSHCNLRCVYCQNFQISQPQTVIPNEVTDYETAVGQIISILRKNVDFLGFVSPTSHIPHMLRIIELVNEQGFFPKIIYNTNAYETVETLRQLENVVDIYLPDFKYADDEIGKQLSGIQNYSKIAISAIKEMYRQKKSQIKDENPALIIRHLVLPNHVENSLAALKMIAKECSTDVFVSLMSQYFPVYKALEIKKINRAITTTEYNRVLDVLDELGFERGWTQLLESNDYYQPDFTKENPFE
ncbi:MAG: 4Fe-4S cluster-binding domain-containing protein [Bacteroidales bacterium]|nr:4Fe-4S cluster-binding domain-containing protein [Bacteroidales bacterium]